MEGKRSSPGVKGKKLVLTDLKTKLTCFSPAQYVLFSDLLPVSSLCFSRELVTLICGLSHTANKMGQAGSREGTGSPWMRWGLSVMMGSCLCLLGSAVSVARRSILWAYARWRVCPVVCPGLSHTRLKLPQVKFFVFEWLQQPNASLACHCEELGRETPICSPWFVCLFIYFRKRNTGSTNTKASKRIKSQRKVVVPRVRTAVTARAMKKGPQTCHPRSCWDGRRQETVGFQKPSEARWNLAVFA